MFAIGQLHPLCTCRRDDDVDECSFGQEACHLATRHGVDTARKAIVADDDQAACALGARQPATGFGDRSIDVRAVARCERADLAVDTCRCSDGRLPAREQWLDLPRVRDHLHARLRRHVLQVRGHDRASVVDFVAGERARMVQNDRGMQIRRHARELLREIELDACDVVAPERKASCEHTDTRFAERPFRECRRREREPSQMLFGRISSTSFVEPVVFAARLRGNKVIEPRLGHQDVAAIAVEATGRFDREVDRDRSFVGCRDIDGHEAIGAGDAHGPPSIRPGVLLGPERIELLVGSIGIDKCEHVALAAYRRDRARHDGQLGNRHLKPGLHRGEVEVEFESRGQLDVTCSEARRHSRRRVGIGAGRAGPCHEQSEHGEPAHVPVTAPTGGRFRRWATRWACRR
jgi:hypothetical protein